MIQKVLFKIIFIIFLFSAINAELLKPSIGGEKKEILIISDKRRVYTVLDNDSLVYDVYGPARLELISRYPVNNKTKKSQKFNIPYVVLYTIFQYYSPDKYCNILFKSKSVGIEL